MRVTDQTSLSQALREVARGQGRLSATERKASSGVQVDRPSDDPGAWGRIQQDGDALLRIEAYQANINLVRSRMLATEASLQGMNGLLTRFRELTMMALNEVAFTENVAVEAEAVHEELTRLANASYGGDYLYGGFSGQPPFSGGRFVGDSQKRAVPISPLGVTLFGVTAEEVFGVKPGDTVFASLADAVAGMRAGDRGRIVAGLDAVDQALGRTARALGQVGAQQATLTTTEQANEEYATLLKKSIGTERDINPAEVYSQLAADRYTLESTYAVLGSVGRLSLLKYL